MASTTAEFSGADDTTTQPFKVAANWQIQWQTTAGKRFVVELLGADDASRGMLIDAGGKPDGSVFVSDAGEFRLKVGADGDWSMKIISRPAE